MQKILVLVVAIVQCFSLCAQQRSAEEAIAIAKEFAGSAVSRPHNLKTSKPQNLKVSYTAKRGNTVCYYVINNPEGGWMIVSGDGVTTTDILAYSDEGNFDIDKAALGAKDMLMQYENEIVYAISQQSSLTSKPQNLKTLQPKHADRHDVSPFLTTQWNQNDPYWNMCPQTSGGRCLVGCVATAMAQVMNYWEWPVRGSFSYTYLCDKISQTVSSNFSQHTYDWANMRDTYGFTATSAQKNAVAQLSYDCAVSVNMAFGTGSSGAYLEDACKALKRYFGYDLGATFVSIGSYPGDSWGDLLYEEVAAGRPVPYAGYNDDEGHAFVVDGYQASSGKFHFNFGWSGSSDGYWTLSNISSHNFNMYGNQAVIGVKRPDDGRTSATLSASQPYLVKHVSSGLYLNTKNLSTGQDAGNVSLRSQGTPLFFTSENNGWYYVNEYPESSGKYVGANRWNTKPTDDACGWLLFDGTASGRFYLYQMTGNAGYMATDANTAGAALYCDKNNTAKQEFVLEPYDGELTYTYTVNVRCTEDVQGGVMYNSSPVYNNGTFEHTGTLNASDITAINVAGYTATVEVHGVNITVTYERSGYDICFNKTQTYTQNDRHINGVKLVSDYSGEQSLTVPYSSASETRCYQYLTLDDESKKFTVYAGETLTPTFLWTGAWMHGFVYLDDDKDGSFTGDLVSQSNTSLPSDNGCLNKAPTLPAFTAPSVPGTYRMRFKVDWDNTDPAGYAGDNGDPVDGNNGIIKNGGSITDVILVVQEAPVVLYTANLLSSSDILSMPNGSSKTVVIGNPNKHTGYFFGFNGQKISSPFGTSMTEGLANALQLAQNDDYRMILHKTADGKYSIGSESQSGRFLVQTPTWTFTEFGWTVLAVDALSKNGDMPNGYQNSDLVRFSTDGGANYLRSSGNVNNWTIGSQTDEWSIWSIYELTPSKPAAWTNLHNLVHAAQTRADETTEEGMIGNNPGQYPSSAVNALNEEIVKANALLDNENATNEQLLAETELLQPLLDAVVINMPIKGHSYLLHSAKNANNYLYENNSGAPKSFNDFTDENRVWIYTTEGYLQNAQSGKYLHGVTATKVNVAEGNEGQTVTFTSLGQRQFTIIPDAGEGSLPLHDPSWGWAGLVGWVDGLNSGSAWYIEEAVTVVIGDVNGDGNVNITDVVELNQHLLTGTEGELNPVAADINADGIINITDVVELIALILR